MRKKLSKSCSTVVLECHDRKTERERERERERGREGERACLRVWEVFKLLAAAGLSLRSVLSTKNTATRPILPTREGPDVHRDSFSKKTPRWTHDRKGRLAWACTVGWKDDQLRHDAWSGHASRMYWQIFYITFSILAGAGRGARRLAIVFFLEGFPESRKPMRNTPLASTGA